MNRAQTSLLCACALLLSACGGTKLVRKPAELPPITQALATASDATLAAQLDFVIVRNGPGAWAKNGDWDEYLLQVRNASASPVRVLAVELTDAQGTRVLPLQGRKALVQASKQAARRFRDAGIRVEAGRGGSALLAAGVGAGVLGYGAASAAATGAALGAGGAAGGGAAAAAGGLILAAPVLVGMGIVRVVNNSKVDQRIGERATDLPVELPASGARTLDLFYPITPGTRELTLRYQDSAGEHVLVVPTQAALGTLHLVNAPSGDERAR